MNIKEAIQNLNDIVHKEINEKILTSKGEELIGSLRECWKIQRDNFSEGDIQLLKKISYQLEALQDFIEILEDFPYLTTKDDVDETIGSLYSVVEKVDDLAVNARIQKEIRELIERKSSLPSKIEREGDKNLSDAINRLDSNAPICKKCGSSMVIREGNGAYFWGCSMFPKCWGKQWLSQFELNLIPD